MNATMNVVVKILAFADEQTNSNPRLRFVDWLRDVSGTIVTDPKTEGHRLLPGQTLALFDGTRSTSIASDSAFSLALLAVEGASRYRITWTGGTNPGLRTGRSITGNTALLTFTTQLNGTLLLNSSISLFASVQSGDEVFIPHTTTGDTANVISVLNAGYWVVLSVVDGSNIVLTRPSGEDFEGVSEAVTLTSNSQLRIYSSTGVQVTDSVDITAGFDLAIRKSFDVVAVTDKFFEVVSTSPLPSQTSVTPTVTGMIFYSQTKEFLYVESTQEIVVRVNGDTGDYQRVYPVDASDPLKPGMYMRRGPTWKLSVYNRSQSVSNITVIHCE